MGVDPLGPVVIGAREIYDSVVKLTGRTEQVLRALDDHTADLKDHESRLRALEGARWPLPTLAVLVSIAALVLAFLRR